MNEYERLRAELRGVLDQVANLTEENAKLKTENKELTDCVRALKEQLEDFDKGDVAALAKPIEWHFCGGGIWKTDSIGGFMKFVISEYGSPPLFAIETEIEGERTVIEQGYTAREDAEADAQRYAESMAYFLCGGEE